MQSEVDKLKEHCLELRTKKVSRCMSKASWKVPRHHMKKEPG